MAYGAKSMQLSPLNVRIYQVIYKEPVLAAIGYKE